MTFLHPAWLWLVLLVPVVVYFNIDILRRRVVPVSSLFIWRRVLDVTRSRPFFGVLRRAALVSAKILLVTCAAALLGGMRLTRGSAGRVFLLDNTAPMAARPGGGGVSAYENALAYLLGNVHGKDAVYTTWPRLRIVSPPAVPARPGWGSRDTADLVDRVAALHPGRRVVVLSDRFPSPGFTAASPVEWRAFGGTVSTAGVLGICPGRGGIYLTLVNTGKTRDVGIRVWGDRRLKVDDRVRLAPGVTEKWIRTDIAGIRVLEAVVEAEGDGWPADDYLCVPVASPAEAYLLGGAIPPAFVLFMRASGIRVERVSEPPAEADGEIGVMAGRLPAVLPPGRYLLLRPEGRVAGISFSPKSRPIEGKLSVVRSSRVTAHMPARIDIAVSLTHDAAPARGTVLAVDGRPALGAWEGGGYRLVYVLCGIDGGQFARTAFFPVLMQNILEYLSGGVGPGSSLRVGDFVRGGSRDLVYTVWRGDERVGRFPVPAGEERVLVEPGVYAGKGGDLWAVSPGASAAGYSETASGVRRYGPERSARVRAGLDTYPLLWGAVVLLLLLLAVVEKK